MGDSSPNAGTRYSLTIGDGPTEYVDPVPVGLFAQQLEHLSDAMDDVGNITVDGVGSNGTMHLSELGNMYSDGSLGEMNLDELDVSGPNSMGAYQFGGIGLEWGPYGLGNRVEYIGYRVELGEYFNRFDLVSPV